MTATKPWARVLLAGLTAPLIGVVVAVAASLLYYLVIAPSAGSDEGLSWSMLRGLGFLVALVLPVAYALEVLIGLPAYILLRRDPARGLSLGAVVGIAAAGSMVTLALFWALYAGLDSEGEIVRVVALGFVGGAATGAWFWLVAFRGRQPGPPR